MFASIDQCGNKRSLAYIIEVAVEVLEVHIEVHKIASTVYGAIGSIDIWRWFQHIFEFGRFRTIGTEFV